LVEIKTAGEIDAIRAAGRVVAADGSRAAHVEHTIAVTDSGPAVLTAGCGRQQDDVEFGHAG
jgi:hypothetical protein